MADPFIVDHFSDVKWRVGKTADGRRLRRPRLDDVPIDRGRCSVRGVKSRFGVILLSADGAVEDNPRTLVRWIARICEPGWEWIIRSGDVWDGDVEPT